MSQPQPQPKVKKAITRSRNGCWTCRERRKKCDEKRPHCTPCVRKSLKCGGYSPRLKWGNGVASRGYLTGSSIPVHSKDNKRGQTASNNKNKSDDDDKASSSLQQSTSPEIGSSSSGASLGLNFATPPESISPDPCSQKAVALHFQRGLPSISAIPLTPFDERLFQEFKEWGSQHLLSGSDPDNSPFGEILAFCADSKSLVSNCLTFQITLHEEYERKFEAYYAESLRLYRQDICDPESAIKDATLVAGILLCSIGMNGGMNWTIHLNGLYSIIQYRNSVTLPSHTTSDIIDAVGFFDLPTHVIGRQTKPLSIWRDYCRCKTGIENNSGIPYTLLDLFSVIAYPGVEMQFWTWAWPWDNDPKVSPLQRLAWDATRMAGILSARESKEAQSRIQAQVQETFSLSLDSNASPSPVSPSPPPDGCPSTPVLIDAIITTLKTINDTVTDPMKLFEILNLLLYPAFMAGSQRAFLSLSQRNDIEILWRGFFFDDGADGGDSPYIQAPFDILRELWNDKRGRSADEIARDKGIEIGLF